MPIGAGRGPGLIPVVVLSQIPVRFLCFTSVFLPCSALSLASWFVARFLCLAPVFVRCPALSLASWFAARFLCFALVFFPYSGLFPASYR